jgi:Transmembrane secretion effector
LIGAVGQGWSFLINAAACALVVIMVSVIRPTQAAPTASRTSQRGQLRAGLGYIRRTSEIAWTIVLVGSVGVLGLNLPVILTAFADHVFDTGVGGYSLYNSANAAGAFLGAVLSARRSQIPRVRVLVVLLVAFGSATALNSLAPNQWWFVAGLVTSGALTLLFLTGANSLVQTSAPASLRGRVMSVYIIVLLGGQAIGGPIVGRLTDEFGAQHGPVWRAADRAREWVRGDHRPAGAPRPGDGRAPPARTVTGPDRLQLTRPRPTSRPLRSGPAASGPAASEPATSTAPEPVAPGGTALSRAPRRQVDLAGATGR